MSRNISKEFGISERITLFYIGDKYYNRSSTHMSSIYVAETFQRFDWGFVNIILSEGKEVLIRPATEEEIKWADENLEKINKKLDAIGN